MTKPEKATGTKTDDERDPNHLDINLEEGELPREAVAKVAASPIVRGASTARSYVEPIVGAVDMGAYVERLVGQTQAVTGGDLSSLEAMLTVQAGTLDAVFNKLANQASQANHVSTQEVLLRTALKAQAQCANTVKVLGELKQPKSIAFIRQANVANQQQINNGVPPSGASRTRTHARPENQSNELLTEQHGTTLDTRTTGGTGRGNQALEAVGAINRADDR